MRTQTTPKRISITVRFHPDLDEITAACAQAIRNKGITNRRPSRAAVLEILRSWYSTHGSSIDAMGIEEYMSGEPVHGCPTSRILSYGFGHTWVCDCDPDDVAEEEWRQAEALRDRLFPVVDGVAPYYVGSAAASNPQPMERAI